MNENIQSIMYLVILIVVFALPPLLKSLEKIFVKGSSEENDTTAPYEEDEMEEYLEERMLKKNRKASRREYTEIDSSPIHPRWW